MPFCVGADLPWTSPILVYYQQNLRLDHSFGFQLARRARTGWLCSGNGWYTMVSILRRRTWRVAQTYLLMLALVLAPGVQPLQRCCFGASNRQCDICVVCSPELTEEFGVSQGTALPQRSCCNLSKPELGSPSCCSSSAEKPTPTAPIESATENSQARPAAAITSRCGCQCSQGKSTPVTARESSSEATRSLPPAEFSHRLPNPDWRSGGEATGSSDNRGLESGKQRCALLCRWLH